MGLDVLNKIGIETLLRKENIFQNRVFAQAGWAIFNELKGFASNRISSWALCGKKLFQKAFGNGHRQVGISCLEILPNEKGSL